MKYSTHPLKIALGLLITATLVACGGGKLYVGAPPTNTKLINIDFNTNAEGWVAGFADYPAGQETFYELTSSHASLPSSLGQNRKGIKISGNNHSDDLFMFVTKKFTGFEPNTRYEIDFELGIGTDVHSGCSGIGGSPGDSVYVKAGAAKIEPKPVNDGTGFYLMNIDKNNQATGGSDTMVIGNIGNGLACESTDQSYKKKTLKSETGKFTTYSDANGALWVIFGTDSGFEGTTTIYFIDAAIKLTKR
ncbi:hypothetical protein GCM10011613_00740 [Cellvibrio zantedeschiae]|uniref:Lipoprotein n=1 Tax=Cellvibrio zantedeschiae TaxID=1237077 RepID=A0ABQ3AMP5_9GAMM|nr:hypothetical protein [Cellvibrio zantedeschiae]GGY61210.1 hypothetical protein GCM10011613_00740 [Cellvibrio zantedeschiae]